MSEWRPISTHPRNEYIMGYFPDAAAEFQIMIVGFLVSDDPCDEGDWYELCQANSAPLDVEPSHWMPLPWLTLPKPRRFQPDAEVSRTPLASPSSRGS